MADIIPLCEQKKILHEFRDTVSDILKPEHDDQYLLRWLIARDFDINRAEKMIRKSFKFMHNIEAENILTNGYIPSKIGVPYVPTQFWGIDPEGYPVRCLFIGLMDVKGLARTFHIVDWAKYMIYLIESDLEHAKQYANKITERRLKIRIVFDIKDFNMRQVLDKEVFKVASFMMTMYQDNFPELLEVVYIINGPLIIQTLVAMFRPFVHEKTWKKVKIYSSDCWKEDILKICGSKIVPKFFGGELEETEWDPLTFYEKTDGGKVPVEYYRKQELYLNETEQGIMTTFIQRRGVFEHSIDVPKRNTTLKWAFQTKDYNIRFGLLFRKTQECNNEIVNEEILVPQIVESHLIPERGEILCKKPGKYILCFDNTYSWVMKKQLFLKVEVDQLGQ